MSTKIEYNGSVVATVEGGNTATLPIKDKKMKSDIKITVPEAEEVVLQEKTVMANGEVTADEGYDGLSKVTVAVPSETVEEYDGTIMIRDIELAGTWVLNRAMYFPLDFDTAKATVDGLSADERIDFLTLDCDIYINGALDSKPTLAFYGSAFETRRGIYFGVTDGTTYTTYATFYNKQYETVTVNVNRAVSQASFEITNITNVSDKELVLTWLKANATKQ